MIAYASNVEKMFLVDVVAIDNQDLTIHVADASSLWHQRYGHLNLDYLISLQKNNMVCGLPVFTKSTNVCYSCLARKQHRAPFDSSSYQAKGHLDVIHTNLCRPQKASLNGCRYFQIFVDDHTCKIWVYW